MRGPDPLTFGWRPSETSSIVAATFFAIPPAPTRAQRASAISFETARTSQSGWARRTSSTWMKNFDGVHRTVEEAEEQRRSATYRCDQLFPRSPVPDGPTNLVGVRGEGRPHEPGAAVRPSFSGNQVSRQIGSDPTTTEGRGIGAELNEQVADGGAFLLGKVRCRHGRIVCPPPQLLKRAASSDPVVALPAL